MKAILAIICIVCATAYGNPQDENLIKWCIHLKLQEWQRTESFNDLALRYFKAQDSGDVTTEKRLFLELRDEYNQWVELGRQEGVRRIRQRSSHPPLAEFYRKRAESEILAESLARQFSLYR